MSDETTVPDPLAGETTGAPGQSPLVGRVASWALKVIQFSFVQGLVQLLTAVAGLMIVRSLPKSEYALFVIANSIQVVFIQLADLGIGIGVRSIGGRVWQDPARLGQLLQTAFSLRRRFSIGAAVICLPVMIWLLRSNEASVFTTVALCLAVAISVIPLLGLTIWSAGLLLHGRYRWVQRLELANAAVRVGLIGGLALTRINAILAALVGTVTYIIQTSFLRRWARQIADPEAAPNSDDRRELVRLSLKSLPNTVFFCLQGQITLFILTMTRNPVGIADLTALGRLALLFAVFSVMFANVLAPRFARCDDPARLKRLYVALVGGTLLVLLPIVLAACLYPSPFLWLLGDKYAGLGRECGWMVASGCLTQFFGVLWSLNTSKAWISVQSVGYIPAIVIGQVISALCFDLRQFHGVVLFTVVTAAAPIPVMIADACVGLRKAKRQSSHGPEITNAL